MPKLIRFGGVVVGSCMHTYLHACDCSISVIYQVAIIC